MVKNANGILNNYNTGLLLWKALPKEVKLIWASNKEAFILLGFFFLLMWTIFKVFFEFVTISLLFCVLVFWTGGTWDPGIKPTPPALKGKSQPLDCQGSPMEGMCSFLNLLLSKRTDCHSSCCLPHLHLRPEGVVSWREAPEEEGVLPLWQQFSDLNHAIRTLVGLLKHRFLTPPHPTFMIQEIWAGAQECAFWQVPRWL